MPQPSHSIDLLKVNDTENIRVAIEVIDSNAQGICFVVSNDRKLVGVVTDGDIRRSFLQGYSLDSSVNEVMTRECVSLPIDSSEDELARALTRRISHVPLVDPNGVLVDYVSHFRSHRIPVLEPTLSGKEVEYVMECLRTNWISSQGRFVKEFENLFSEMHSNRRAIAVSNGTCALHLAMVALGIGEGDEVIVPDVTFAASANSVIHAGAEPVFVDIDKKNWTIDTAKLEDAIGSRTKAIMPVHLYGHPCNMKEVCEIADRHGLLVVEDAAEALGSMIDGKPVGTHSDAAAFSFFGNKTITTGEGGMVLFRDPQVAQQAAILRDHGMSKTERYWHEHVGFNYRLTNVQSAIGVAQFERIEEFVERKRHIADMYRTAFAGSELLSLPYEENWAFHSYWLFTVLLDPSINRNEMMDQLRLNGVDTRPIFYPMHAMPPFSDARKVGDLSVATDVSNRGLSLPSSVTLTTTDVDQVVSAVKAALGSYAIGSLK